MDNSEPSNKRRRVMLDEDTLDAVAVAFSPGYRAPPTSLAVLDIMLNVTVSEAKCQVEQTKRPSYDSVLTEWMIDYDRGGNDHPDFVESYCDDDQPWVGKIDLRKVSLDYIRLTHSGFKYNTREILFAIHDGWRFRVGDYDDDEEICKKIKDAPYETWEDLEILHLLLCSHIQDVEKEDMCDFGNYFEIGDL
jgi:hypothetical protein